MYETIKGIIMTTFICTVCQNRIIEHGSNVECVCYNDTRSMIEDTTKLYDKSFLCPHFIHVNKRNEQVCKSKHVFKYKYDALKCAYDVFNKNGTMLMPYKCRVCHSYHLTHNCSNDYNPAEEFNKFKNTGNLYG